MVFVDRANMDKWAPFYSLKKKKQQMGKRRPKCHWWK